MGKASMSLLVATMLGFLVLCGSVWAVEPNLVSHWKFDEGSGTIAYDSAGDNHGTIYGAQWTTGQIDGALSFDGAGDYVNCGSDSSLDFTDAITIGAWVKRPNFDTHGGIAGKTNGNSATAGYGLFSYIGGLSFDFYSGGTWRRTTYRVSIPANEWHHVVGTFDGNDAYLYVDGEQKASLAYSGTIPAATGYSFHISFWRTGIPLYFDGSIDDVRIYDRALSAEEIEELYWEGLSPLVLATMQIEEAIAEKEDALGGIDAALEKELVAYGALEELLESGDYGDLNKRDIVKAKQEIHSAMQRQERSADALEGSIEKLYDALAALGWEPEPEPNLREPIAHWKFDEGSGTTAYDSAGSNDGTIYGAQWTTGQVDGALSFDGVNDYVDCGTGPAITGTGNFTVSAWVKVTELPVSGALTVVNQRSITSTNGSYLIYVLSSGYVHFEVYNDGYGFYFDSDVSVGDGFWHHIVEVRTSTTEGKIYIDGNLAGSGSGAAKSLNNVDVVIGRWNGGDLYFDGSIDDVRIYNRALSAEEIQELYLDGLSGSDKGKGK